MEYKDLLGGKGANLAEMTSVLKLPVPPGFTISTDACRAHMRGGWPAGLTDEITKHVAKLEKTMGRKLGDPADPLLVSVRSGAKFSMPGMMDTVLNLGLNDKSVKGLAKVTDDERFAYDSYRRFIAMYGRIVLDVDGELFDHPLEEAKRRSNVKTDAELSAAELKKLCRPLQGRRQGPHRQAVPAATDGAAAGSRRGGLQVVERCQGDRLPGARAHQPRPRHGRQRADDGVRQPRRQLGHRRRVHAQRGDRREPAVRRLPDQGPGRRRRRRHPQHRGPRRPRRALPRRSTTSCSRSSSASSATTATCATPSSRSSRASCGCSRPASASAPAVPRCGWPST